MKIRIRTLIGLYREVRLGLVYVLNGVDRIHSLYTSFSSLSSSCINSLRIPMRIEKKIGFVKVCYNWFTRLSVCYIQDIVNKIPLGATEKPYMKSIYPTLGIRII